MDARDFKKFSFVSIRSPATWGVVVFVVITGLLTGLFAERVFEQQLVIDYGLFTAAFILSILLSAFLIYHLARSFKPKWAYSIAFLNQLSLIAIMAFFRLSSNLSFLDSLVFWTVLAYTSWMISLSGLGAMRIGVKSTVLSLIQPILIWLLIFSSVGMGVGDFAPQIIFLAIGLVLSTFVILFNEHIFSLVFVGMSGMVELSNFLRGVRGEQVSLDMGHEINPLLQYLRFKRGATENVIVAPWLHSGPIRSVGGGNLSTRSIEILNREYGDSFIFHVPCNHEMNPSGSVSERVVKALKSVQYKNLRVSGVVEEKKGLFVVRGQRLNDVFIISLSNDSIDDYDISIFDSLRMRHRDKNVLFVDSHPNPPLKECGNVEKFTKEADVVGELVDRVLERLEDERLNDAQMGTAIRFSSNYSLFALALKTRNESVLYLISDTNGLSPSEAKAMRMIGGSLGIDEILHFTTDTHSLSFKDLIKRPDIPEGVIRETIKTALERCEPTKMGYGEVWLKGVRILGRTYYELTTLVGIMARVVPILFLLVLLFLGLLLWIF